MNNNSTMTVSRKVGICDRCLESTDNMHCPICLELLDSSSKILPCKHTFCERCLYASLTMDGLVCHVCGMLCEDRIEELPHNRLLVYLSDCLKYLQTEKADSSTDIASRSAESSSSSQQRTLPQPIRNLPQMPSATDLSAEEQARVGGGQMQRYQGQKQLILEDALSYLDQVERTFAGNCQVYINFLEVMNEFKYMRVDITGVVERISDLFREHPELILGFNRFLPDDYVIEVPPSGKGDPASIELTELELKEGCLICKKYKDMNMRLCNECLQYVHEEIQEFTEEEKEKFCCDLGKAFD